MSDAMPAPAAPEASDAQPVRLHISFSEEKKARHAVNCVTQDYKKDGVT